jgi:hypothetical protein
MPTKTSTRQAATAASIHSQSKTQLDDLLAAKKEWSARLLQTPRPTGFRAFAAAPVAEPDQNVQGVGVGEKFQDQKPTGVLAVKFFVTSSLWEIQRRLARRVTRVR